MMKHQDLNHLEEGRFYVAYLPMSQYIEGSQAKTQQNLEAGPEAESME